MDTRRNEWKDLPTHPDLKRNLGYELIDLEVIRPENDSNFLVFLPQDEELLRDDAFLLADEDIVCNVANNR
ncbi:hypothetical protein VB773_22175 [Haloarculaceae archaeon H-GB2-1]|nr:hypothetical protein [Haloarculaceae archaeon H-GB1-1]MEA5389537.1 hypothetical protein [Haloarculaceae archaeon H-GB11]MEA5410008.1 hypothetical protein [Haloarculaceae archaeon H-GB2-1]